MTALPKGWAKARLDQLLAPEPAAITDGPFGSNLKTEHYTSSGPRVIRLQNIGEGVFRDERAHISPERYDALKKHEARSGDVVVAALGEVLPRACVIPDLVGPAIVKADCVRVRLSSEVNPYFVNAMLNSSPVRRAASAEISGVGRPRLNLAKIRSIQLPVPPRAEQDRIVGVIEEQFSRLQEGDHLLDSVAQRLDALLVSMRASLSDARLPRRRLRDVADTQLGKMLSAKSRTGVGSTPYLRNRNVRWGVVDVSEVAYMDFTEEERKKFSLEPGDVLICEGGAGVGRTAVWRGELDVCCYQKALHRVRVGPELLPEFFCQFMRHFVESRAMDQHLSGVAIGHLPQEDLRVLEVPVPALDEQRRWLESMDAVESVARAISETIRHARRRADNLRRSVLTEAFAGRLAPQDPSDEPASELLARITAERVDVPKARRRQRA